MKNKIYTLTLFFSLGCAVFSHAQCTGSHPIISQIVESGANKAVEIFNPTGGPINLALYELVRVQNGNGNLNTAVAFSGTLVSGGIYVIANPSCEPSVLSLANQSSNIINHNGNDSYILRLVSNQTVIDSYGDADSNITFGANANQQRLMGGACPYDTDPYDPFNPAAYYSTAYSTGIPEGLGVVGVLPVELLRFQGKSLSNSVELSWLTLSEQNNAMFLVERSANANNFESIGELKGALQSSEAIQYTFEDEKPLKGINYYRLRQIDMDGAYTFSPVVSVSYLENKIQLSHNLVEDRFFVKGASLDESVKIQLFNLQGQQVLATSTNGQNWIELSNMVSGLYFVHITVNNETFTERILVK